MTISPVVEPSIIHAIPGRVRIYAPGWPEPVRDTIVARLRCLPGIRGVAGNPLTATILIYFDITVLDAQSILSLLSTSLPTI